MARREVEPTTELGRQLEKERQNRGLTKESWIEMLDVTKPTYLGWLRGSQPELGNIFHISDVLDLPYHEVFSWVVTDHAKGVYLSSFSQSAFDFDAAEFDPVEFAESYAKTRELFDDAAA